MKTTSLILSMAMLASLTASMCAAEQRTDASMRSTNDYGRGERLERCLMYDCAVYTATIQSVEPAQPPASPTESARQALTLTVDESLRGARIAGQTVSLELIARPEQSKTALGPWNAWESIAPRQGARLLIAEPAPEAVARRAVPAGPALVAHATDLDTTAAVRRILELHDRFENKPASVLDIPQMLEEEKSPMVMGALVAYVTQRETQRDPETTARVSAALVASTKLPATIRNRAADAITADFYRLSATARQAVAERLVSVAAADDPERARPALAVLARQTEDGLLDMQYDARMRAGLLHSYRALLAASRIAPAPRFEAQISGKQVQQ
jgi:hypothetical protein